MLTGQFRTYTPEEVEEFESRLYVLKEEMCENQQKNSSTRVLCKSCKMRHICFDISSFCNKLSTEIRFGYPNCRKK